MWNTTVNNQKTLFLWIFPACLYISVCLPQARNVSIRSFLGYPINTLYSDNKTKLSFIKNNRGIFCWNNFPLYFYPFLGTGKTVTGVHIAFWFAKKNKQGCLGSHDAIDPDTPDKPRAPPQVIYCGPSNRSVDVVAGKLLWKKIWSFFYYHYNCREIWVTSII